MEWGSLQQNLGARQVVSKLGAECSSLVPTGPCLGAEERKTLLALLFLMFPKDPSHIPQALFKLLLLSCTWEGLLCCLLKRGDSISYYSPALRVEPIFL